MEAVSTYTLTTATISPLNWKAIGFLVTIAALYPTSISEDEPATAVRVEDQPEQTSFPQPVEESEAEYCLAGLNDGGAVIHRDSPLTFIEAVAILKLNTLNINVWTYLENNAEKAADIAGIMVSWGPEDHKDNYPEQVHYGHYHPRFIRDIYIHGESHLFFGDELDVHKYDYKP